MAINEMSSPVRGEPGMGELEEFGFQIDRWRPFLCVYKHRLCVAGYHTATASHQSENLPLCRAQAASGRNATSYQVRVA